MITVDEDLTATDLFCGAGGSMNAVPCNVAQWIGVQLREVLDR